MNPRLSERWNTKAEQKNAPEGAASLTRRKSCPSLREDMER